MRSATRWVLMAIASACFAAPAAAEEERAPVQNELALYRARQIVIEEAASRVAPSVVTIETVGGTQPMSSRGGGPGGGRGPGNPTFIVADGPTTGLVFDRNGLIITSAFNFVREPSVITVTLHDGRRFVGELLARDEIRRLAMVKIEADDLPEPEWIEKAESVRVGQTALVLGRGFRTEEPAISAGIISGKNRQSGLAIQTDAKLSPGNFGGPLIDVEGRVLGLAVPMGMGTSTMAGVEWYDAGIGFAIPWWRMKEAAKDLADGLTVRRGLLGIQVNAQLTKVVRVAVVVDPSPALRAGLQVGDLVIGVDGHTVTDYPSLQRIMATRRAGQRVSVKIKRGDEKLDMSVVLAVPEDLGEVPPLIPPTDGQDGPSPEGDSENDPEDDVPDGLPELPSPQPDRAD